MTPAVLMVAVASILAVLGMCIGQRSFDEIRYHTIMGVANGLTRAEIEAADAADGMVRRVEIPPQ